MANYLDWPPPRTASERPIHENPLAVAGVISYGCQERRPLAKMIFEATCKECIDAAIGFLDAGQIGHRKISGDIPGESTLEDFVKWAQHWARINGWAPATS